MKYLKNFLSYKLFGASKSFEESLEQFYQHTVLNSSHWVSLAINKNNINQSYLTKELDIISASKVYSLKSAEIKEGHNFQLYKNQCREASGILTTELSPRVFIGFNSLIDHTLTSELSYFQKELSLNIGKINFSPMEVSNEEKALEWIKSSFLILEKAILKSLTDKDLLFQSLIFFGHNPKSHHHEIRFITFNIDCKFELLPNGKLRLRVYNDRAGDFGSSKKAELQGDFDYRKRELFDELTKILTVHTQGIKFIF